MKKATMIIDLQYGSTGKGLIAGYLAKRLKPDVIVTAWAPNAGHTFIDDSKKYVHTMLANGIVSPNLKYILVGPGSMIDLPTLEREVLENADLLKNVKILIHPHAGIVLQEHRDQEQKTMISIGSTAKGTGAALMEKIRRDPRHSNVAKKHIPPATNFFIGICSIREYNGIIDNAKEILIEGAQGFSLSINNGFYPYTTSRDVTPMQILADCAVPMSYLKDVVGTLRTYPIRVANRYDSEGNMIGWSGPHYHDQVEMSWEQLGLTPEKTTVTKLQRRVFTFSIAQLKEACRLCEPTKLFLNFVNYLNGEDEIASYIENIEANVGIPVQYLGHGPHENDVEDLRKLK